MSFSGEVKDELAKQISKSRHCRIAELAAIMGFDGRIEQKNGKTVLEITTENAPLARKCFTLIKKTFNISTDIDVRTGNGMGTIISMLFPQINQTRSRRYWRP